MLSALWAKRDTGTLFQIKCRLGLGVSQLSNPSPSLPRHLWLARCLLVQDPAGGERAAQMGGRVGGLVATLYPARCIEPVSKNLLFRF